VKFKARQHRRKGKRGKLGVCAAWRAFVSAGD
jgi:hypothetical protein